MALPDHVELVKANGAWCYYQKRNHQRIYPDQWTADELQGIVDDMRREAATASPRWSQRPPAPP